MGKEDFASARDGVATVGGMPSPRTRRRTLEILLDQAIQLSFPLYTYPEMRQLVRARVHLFYAQRTAAGMRREALARLAGLTPQGMRNLGDARPPCIAGRRGERLLLLWLEAAGPEGLSFAALAERYEAQDAPEGTSLEEALWGLCAEGRIVRLPRGRYAATAPTAEPPHPILAPEGREILLALLAAPGQVLSEAALQAALQARGMVLTPQLLASLEAAGELQRDGDRIALGAAQVGGHRALSQPHAAILDTLLGFGVGAIHAVREQGGAGPAMATGWCVSLPADPDARWPLLARLREQVAAWTAALEAEAQAEGVPLTTVEILLTAAEPQEP